MQKITKAVIPAAGLGTRFLPATKTVPKEMLTIVDAPIIFYVVEEAVQAGIEDIVLIAGRGKTAIEDFFDSSYEVEDKLAKDGKMHLLERLIKIRDMANIISIRQKHPLGLGHAVGCAQKVIGDNPFAVLLGDEITVARKPSESGIGKLVNLFAQNQSSTVAVMQVEQNQVSKYGIADLKEVSPDYFKVAGFVEKPSPDKAPSNWALPGRYVFTSEIFQYIKDSKPGMLGELQLTDAMNSLAKNKDFFASSLTAERFDAGDKLGYLKANVELGLKNAEMKDDFKNYLKSLVRSFKD